MSRWGSSTKSWLSPSWDLLGVIGVNPWLHHWDINVGQKYQVHAAPESQAELCVRAAWDNGALLYRGCWTEFVQCDWSLIFHLRTMLWRVGLHTKSLVFKMLKLFGVLLSYLCVIWQNCKWSTQNKRSKFQPCGTMHEIYLSYARDNTDNSEMQIKQFHPFILITWVSDMVWHQEIPHWRQIRWHQPLRQQRPYAQEDAQKSRAYQRGRSRGRIWARQKGAVSIHYYRAFQHTIKFDNLDLITIHNSPSLTTNVT